MIGDVAHRPCQMMRKLNSRVLLTVVLVLLPLVALAKQWSPQYEQKVGKEAAAEVEKKWKVITDEAQQKQLDEMVKVLGAVTERPDVPYTVKIIDESEVNAFSLPGGFVYVTKGLLADVQSEHELAGVLAHEICHNTFYDALERGEKNQKLFMGSLAVTIAALLLGASGEQATGALLAGEYIRLGVLSQYSMKLESRADAEGIKYLIATKRYNPVGLLTFMERLAARERHKPKVELGIYADHPDTDLRAQKITELLEQANVEVNRRAVTKWDPPKAEEKDVEGRKVAVLSLWGVEILRTEYAGDAESPLKRTEALAEKLRVALAADLQDYEIAADTKGPDPHIMLGDSDWCAVPAEDAATAKLSRPELAKQIAENLRAAMHKEHLDRWW